MLCVADRIKDESNAIFFAVLVLFFFTPTIQYFVGHIRLNFIEPDSNQGFFIRFEIYD